MSYGYQPNQQQQGQYGQPQQQYGAPQQQYGQPQQQYGQPQQQHGGPPQYGAPHGAPHQAQRAPSGGGFAPQAPPAPQGADPQLWGWFTAVDVDRSNHISATELQQALVNGDWSPFDLDTVKLLMTIFDTDRSGTVTFNEFSGLWRYIKDWQGVFRHFDQDRSGSIDGRELANALGQFGFQLSPAALQLVERKYVLTKATAPQPGAYGPPPGITFDRFVRCCVVVKQLTESFQKLDTAKAGTIHLTYDQFMQTVLAAP